MEYKIRPSKISGHVYVPPSKSHTLRALLFALMGRGLSCIRNYLASPDTLSMIEAIKQFGAKVTVFHDVIEVEGVGGDLAKPNDVINAGNSGIVLRFISGISTLIDSYVILTGDESIRLRRPIKPLLDTLTAQRVFAESALLNGHPPVIIKGPLKPGIMAIEGVDSQPVSALLIASSFLQGSSEIYVMNPGEKPWIDVTLSWLEGLNIKVENNDYRHYKIPGHAFYNGFDVTIPGDFSSATYPIVAAIITKQKIRLTGLDMSDAQADKYFIDILIKMGVKVYTEEFSLEIDGDVDLQGIKIDVNHCIDVTPLLAVLACFAKAPTTITGAKIARYKESDRISSITKELQKMGAKIEENEDGMVIYPSALHGTHVTSYKDHRIALSLMIAGFAASGETVVDEVEYIVKTYPTFLYDFMHLGADIR